MTCILRRALVVLAASLAYGVTAGDGSAQSYPTKPLHMSDPLIRLGSRSNSQRSRQIVRCRTIATKGIGVRSGSDRAG